MKALAKDLTIYENSRVIHIEDHLVKTAFGSVKAGKIVFAAHFPFINFPGMYFARMYQERSYVAALWAAQDCMTTDDMPFIGAYAHRRPDWFVATGFQKWGMTSSMAAAMMIRDMICEDTNAYGHVNPYTNINAYKDVFTPSRFSAEEIPGLVKAGTMAVKGLARRFFSLPDRVIADLKPGMGPLWTHNRGRRESIKQSREKFIRLILSILIWDVN